MKVWYQGISYNDYLSLLETVPWLVSVFGDRRRLPHQQRHSLKWLLKINRLQPRSRDELIRLSYYLGG